MEPFFFQAEDGIRDYKVTGVQTCALPIYRQVGTFPKGSDLSARATGKSGPSRKVRTCRHGRPASRDLPGRFGLTGTGDRQVGTFPEGSDLSARATGKSGPSRKVRTCRRGRPGSPDLPGRFGLVGTGDR